MNMSSIQLSYYLQEEYKIIKLWKMAIIIQIFEQFVSIVWTLASCQFNIKQDGTKLLINI